MELPPQQVHQQIRAIVAQQREPTAPICVGCPLRDKCRQENPVHVAFCEARQAASK